MNDSTESVEDGQGEDREIHAVVIAASVGGPPTIEEILTDLPATFPLPIFIVQHFSSHFPRIFAERLERSIDLSVKVAEDGESVEGSRVYIAPGNCHLLIQSMKNRTGNVLRLTENGDTYQHKPSADLLMESVARTYGRHTLGIVLTGMGNDGTQGLMTIKEGGGTTIAEADETSQIFGMPRSAIEEGVVDFVLPSDQISRQIREMV